MDPVKQRIISSVFSKRSSDGQQETYVSHVKIWEETEEGGKKPRYILLSQTPSGQGFIHKSKMNTNNSFSVGKTWKLSELRGLEIVNPGAFNITLARTYRWQTEDPREQGEFIAAAVKTFRQLPDGNLSPLSLINVPEPETNVSNGLPQSPGRTTTPSKNLPMGRRSPGLGPRISPSGNSRTSPKLAAAQPQVMSPPPGRPSFQSSIRPDSMTSLRSSASAPSVYNPRGTPPVSEMPPPVSRSALEQSSRQSLDTVRSSSASERGGSTPRIRRPASPAFSAPSSRSRNTPSPIPPPTPSSRSQNTPSPIPPSSRSRNTPSPIPATTPRAPTPQSRRVRRKESEESERPQPRREPSSSTIAPGRKDPNARISFFDPSNQSSIDRLLMGGRGGLEEESAEATMANVEEMLEGYEWASDSTIGAGGKRKRGAADQIEARLQDELMALEKANIYAFLEDDDRVGLVLKFIDDAVRELDSMDTLVSSYKIHLNAVSDDISFIQSQNRGLQVQTQNQKALLTELEQLLQTVHVDRESLVTLTQESLEKANGIQRLEEAASELYKALLAGRDTEMAATMERLEEYRTHNNQFCKRLHDFLQIMFSVQCDRTLTDKGRIPGDIRRHDQLEAYLGRYAGLMLYLKEMGEDWYSKVCAAYFSAASGLHNQEMRDLFSTYAVRVKKATEEESEMGFSPPQVSTIRGAEPLRRAKSLARSPMESRNKDRRPDGEVRGSEALDLVLHQIGPQIYHEEQFIADFLQINDASLTFADYLNLENYFRRQASRSAGLGSSTTKLVRGAMDLIFGFLAGEIKMWIDNALAKDGIQIVGTLVALEAAMTEGEERGNMFWTKVLQKQHQRIKGLFDRHVDEQIRAIEQTKLTTKKRKGVAHFIKYFPTYVGRVETQLIGADVLDVRNLVDTAYEKIVQSMFESLKQMAKMQGEGEDKGQLNYHVELVENMQYFISEISQQEIGTVKMFVQRAQALYDENLNAYVKLVLRRPLAKILDFFDGIERLLQTTAASEVQNNSNYNKSSLKRVVKEYNAKDMRRYIDSLYKRVEKHYADSGEEHAGNSMIVLKAVWTACEQELVKSTERFSRVIAQCYKDTGVTLEYGVQDVETACRKHRFAGQT